MKHDKIWNNVIYDNGIRKQCFQINELVIFASHFLKSKAHSSTHNTQVAYSHCQRETPPIFLPPDNYFLNFWSQREIAEVITPVILCKRATHLSV